jgi:acetyl esterase/lipase
MQRSACALLALTLVVAVGAGDLLPAAEPSTLDVWPGPAPGEKGKFGPERTQPQKPGDKPVKLLTDISHPTLTVYRPARDKDTGAAVLIAPGGGYNILAWDLEGEEVARWLNSIGVTGIILKYRVPRREGTPRDQPPVQALMDAQRAMSLVRSKASEWGLDQRRIGMLGFSAGGHLTAWTSTQHEGRAYPTVDQVDAVSCRPDFAVLIYPGGMDRKGDASSPIAHVTAATPPMFLAHAADDPVSCRNSVEMFLALKDAKVKAELHVYTSGGHGFGLRPSDHPCSSWPKRCEEWLRDQGLLAPGGSK